MNYGLYLSAAGALTGMHRQNVLSNNLANVNTVGFKPDETFARQRLPERLENGVADATPSELLERLGGGRAAGRSLVRLAQGTLVHSGNPLDLAIEGDGFFVVGSGEAQHLTRDGRFTLNDQGEVVMIATGQPLLSSAGRPITVDTRRDIQIRSDGSVMQGNQPVAQILVTAAPDREQLMKVGDNQFRRLDGAEPGTELASGLVRQGYTEASAVDPILTMTEIMSNAKAIEANLRLMQYHDQLLGQLANTFGRVN